MKRNTITRFAAWAAFAFGIGAALPLCAAELAHRWSFNGDEIADNSLNTFFAPVEDIGRARKTVDWGRALQPAGQKRLALIRRLAKMRHEQAIFADGTQEWVTNGEEKNTVAFVRRLGDHMVFVAANLRPTESAFIPDGVRLDPAKRPMMSENASVDPDGTCRLGGYGYIVQEF